MNSSNREKHVVVVGAGMAGVYSALLLSQKGYRVTVLERQSDPRMTAEYHGRSINFTLSFRGLQALKKVNLDIAAMSRAVEVKNRVVHLKCGAVSAQSYGRVADSGLLGRAPDLGQPDLDFV